MRLADKHDHIGRTWTATGVYERTGEWYAIRYVRLRDNHAMRIVEAHGPLTAEERHYNEGWSDEELERILGDQEPDILDECAAWLEKQDFRLEG